jgi:hypothetical protein
MEVESYASGEGRLAARPPMTERVTINDWLKVRSVHECSYGHEWGDGKAQPALA